MICAKCRGAITDKSRFCKACGTPAEGPPTCAQCQRPLEADAQFCGSCGTRASVKLQRRSNTKTFIVCFGFTLLQLLTLRYPPVESADYLGGVWEGWHWIPLSLLILPIVVVGLTVGGPFLRGMYWGLVWGIVVTAPLTPLGRMAYPDLEGWSGTVTACGALLFSLCIFPLKRIFRRLNRKRWIYDSSIEKVERVRAFMLGYFFVDYFLFPVVENALNSTITDSWVYVYMTFGISVLAGVAAHKHQPRLSALLA